MLYFNLSNCKIYFSVLILVYKLIFFNIKKNHPFHPFFVCLTVKVVMNGEVKNLTASWLIWKSELKCFLTYCHFVAWHRLWNCGSVSRTYTELAITCYCECRLTHTFVTLHTNWVLWIVTNWMKCHGVVLWFGKGFCSIVFFLKKSL